MRCYRKLVLPSVGLALSLAMPAAADPVSDFYSGKQVTFICATGPSGDYAVYSQLVVRHIGRHIPGNPKVRIQFMPGAGGIIGANHMYNVAPKDGTVMGMPLSSISLNQLLQPDKIRYDASKLSYIGVIMSLPDVIAVWHQTKVRLLDDARKTSVNIASTSSSAQNHLTPMLANALLGTRFRMVTGYATSGDMDQAIERGEAEGRLIAWQTWMVLKRDWIDQKKVIPLIQAGDYRMAELPHVPSFIDLVKDEDDKRMVEMLHATTQLSRAVYAPPDLPADRLAALRKAFDSLMKDPKFIQEVQSVGMEIRPQSGEAIGAAVARLLSTPAPVVAKFNKVTGFGK